MTKNEKLAIFQPETGTLSITFLVLPGASIMCVASAIDPLRAANRISGEELYRWSIVSPDGSQPVTTSGLPVTVSGKFVPAANHDVLIVIGGFGTSVFSRGPFIAGLAKAARRARAVGGIEAGTWLLGHAGLLEGRKATTHFEDLEDFSAAFPGSHVLPERYVIDGPVFTCGGASPALDLMLYLIGSRQGASLAMNVASVFVYDQARAPSDAQPMVSAGQIDQRDPRVALAIRLMEKTIDSPLAISTIAARIGVSARTLENAFTKVIGETPGHYYLGLRLAAARKMVTDTRLSIADIATRTGFSSSAAFSRAFKAKYARPPSEIR